MLSLDKLQIKVNNILSTTYPIKKTFSEINSLSHFWIINLTNNEFLPFKINISGEILNGKYKSYKIIKVNTTTNYSWNKYLIIYISLLNLSLNPCINPDYLLNELQKNNKLDILHINYFIIKNENSIIKLPIKYQ
jgi:hypothetical protein